MLSAVALGLTIMAWAEPAGGQQAAADKAKAQAADTEAQEKGSPTQPATSIDKLYSEANEAYEKENFFAAYRLYRQLLRRKDELGWWQAWTVQDNFEATKQALAQQKEGAERKQKARETLELIKQALKNENVDTARTHLDRMKEQGLAQYLSEDGRAELQAAQEKLAKSQQSEAATAEKEEAERDAAEEEEQDEEEKTEPEPADDEARARKEAPEKAAEAWNSAREAIENEDYSTAARLIKQMEQQDILSKLDDSRRNRVTAWRRAVYREAGDAGVLTAAQRREIAEAKFQSGMQSYREGRYARAKQLLDACAALNVDLGWWDNWTLSDTRQELEAMMGDLQERLQSAKSLHENDKLTEARQEFLQLQQRLKDGAEAFPQMSKTVQNHLDRIDSELRSRRVEQARDYRKKIEQLSQERERRLSQVQKRRQARQTVLTNVQKSGTLLEDGKYDRAEELLQSAKSTLEELDWRGDQQLEGARETIQERLARVREAREKSTAEKEIAGALKAAQEVAASTPRKALANIQKAKDIAARSGMSLSEEQKQTIQGVREKLGVRFLFAREQVDELKKQAARYEETGELEKAIQSLELARDIGQENLTEDERQRLSDRLDVAKQHLDDRQDTLEEINSLTDAAEESYETGNLQSAAERCERAIRMAESESIPNTSIVGLLEVYRRALDKGSTELAPQLASEDKGKIQETARRLQALLPYDRARYYLEQGSPDAARPWLEKVAEAEDKLDEQKTSWAAEKLTDIASKIEELHDEELAARADQLEEVYNLEKKFTRLGDDSYERVQKMESKLDTARLNLRIKKLQQYMERNAYPMAWKVLQEGVPESADKSLVQGTYRELAEKVRGWHEASQLAEQGLKQLVEWKPKEALSSLENLMNVTEVGPVALFKERMQKPREQLQMAVQKARQKQKQWKQQLATIEERLQNTKLRKERYSAYWAGRKAYARQKWEEAVTALEGLKEEDPAQDGLRSFERSDAMDMHQRAVAEKEATDLYTQAVRAQEIDNKYKLKQALDELEKNYQDTWTYRQHY